MDGARARGRRYDEGSRERLSHGFRLLARPLLWLIHRRIQKPAMSRIAHLCHASFASLHALFPLLGALVAARAESDCIATAIPGLGTCTSTYCKPERRTAIR